ncbi:winged helix-turn-helix transcriptional regulator [Paenibacillus sp. IHBB 10380]|uniref:winged helix-turn-helix transcriptional regulator n=1 Tax=Paenibacillus sp. IHBB 10380 TaxID=1566358 RepID=UPI001185761E|nr:winged helix-turn-helix transcriptional regulator [Paenibacillus sp. IHBB 10380]
MDIQIELELFDPHLTEYGRSLTHIAAALCAWGERHIENNYPDKSAVLLSSDELDYKISQMYPVRI